MIQRLQKFLGRSDLRQNPLKGLRRRLVWHLHWAVSEKPLVVPFAGNLKIGLPQSGSGAAIYYQGFSEPDTADLIRRFLRPGMVMVDIGAHLGEYTLLAAQAVGERGQVHAFEPQPKLMAAVRHNISLNGLTNVTVNQSAVSDRTDPLEFEILREPSMSSIRKRETLERGTQLMQVPSTTLDGYWQQSLPIDLIKVDVEGAEKFVLEGAQSLMASSTAPTWVFEYAPRAYADFNYKPQELLSLLTQQGYHIWEYQGMGTIVPFDPTQARAEIANLIAAKDEVKLRSLLLGQKPDEAAHLVFH